MEIRYSYRDAPTIKAFSQSDAFIRGLMGPFGSGKSSGCVVEIVKRGQAQAPGPDGVRRSRWAVIRNTYPQLRDTTIKTIHQWLPPHLFGQWYANDHRYVIRSFAGVEIEILFRALDRPDQVANLLSLELTGAWINEAREVPWAVIEAIQARVGRYPSRREGGATWFGIFMDTNPPDADSKWFKFFEEGGHPAAFAQIFKQPSGLAPNAENLSNLPGGRLYYENLQQGKSDEWIKVYIHGQYGFVIDGRPVFPEYNDAIHCREIRTISAAPMYRGFDFGLTPAATFSQVLPDGRWIVVDELTSESMGIDHFSDDVLEHSSRCYPQTEWVDIGDPAGMQRAQTDERTCFEILHAKGIQIEPGLQTLAIRLESVRKPLRTLIAGRPQFQIHPRCLTLRKALMGGYQFRRVQTSAERYEDKPDKGPLSHIADALQYPATRIFGDGLTSPRDDGRRRDDDDFVLMGAQQGRSPITGY